MLFASETASRTAELLERRSRHVSWESRARAIRGLLTAKNTECRVVGGQNVCETHVVARTAIVLGQDDAQHASLEKMR